MELTEIKYWVFAHTSYETTGKIPSNLKLYCCNPDAKITQPKQVCPNNTYIGIMPYSKEVWDYYNPKGKTWKDKDGEHWSCENTKPTACMLFELDFKYIVFLFEQIHLLEDYPDNTPEDAAQAQTRPQSESGCNGRRFPSVCRGNESGSEFPPDCLPAKEA